MHEQHTAQRIETEKGVRHLLRKFDVQLTELLSSFLRNEDSLREHVMEQEELLSQLESLMDRTCPASHSQTVSRYRGMLVEVGSLINEKKRRMANLQKKIHQLQQESKPYIMFHQLRAGAHDCQMMQQLIESWHLDPDAAHALIEGLLCAQTHTWTADYSGQMGESTCIWTAEIACTAGMMMLCILLAHTWSDCMPADWRVHSGVVHPALLSLHILPAMMPNMRCVAGS